ncbi:hypothetical protein QE152_g8598 [Popillia japonica]|uniref:Uncharacterized protein n=1 Tax=Popillia japonica TaxID=7064 RepID=A0AAW1LXL7_POPJA
MPKVKMSQQIREWISKSEHLTTDGKAMFCQICSKDVVDSFNGSDSVTIQESQYAFKINKIQSELAYIATHFKMLVQTIKALEASGETLVKNLERITAIRGSFRNAPGVVAKKAYIKLEAVLAKNPGFSVLYEIYQILNGSATNDCTIAVEKYHNTSTDQ